MLQVLRAVKQRYKKKMKEMTVSNPPDEDKSNETADESIESSFEDSGSKYTDEEDNFI